MARLYLGTFETAPAVITKAVPSTACFIKVSEYEMFVISKYKPDNVADSLLLVTDFQGNRANDEDVYEDILFN